MEALVDREAEEARQADREAQVRALLESFTLPDMVISKKLNLIKLKLATGVDVNERDRLVIQHSTTAC